MRQRVDVVWIKQEYNTVTPPKKKITIRMQEKSFDS